MHLKQNDIVSETLHRQVGWDIRHHFMAEKVMDRFGLVLPRDRKLIRQLAVVYVLEGRTKPPEAEAEPAGLRPAAGHGYGGLRREIPKKMISKIHSGTK
jgi:hypothetical protein